MAKKKMITIPFESIVLDKDFNARTDYDEDYIESLKQSIMGSGLLQPIGVTASTTASEDKEPKYFIVYGFCRYLAIAKIREELGNDAYATMDAVLNHGTVDELRDRNLKENIDRKSLKPHEIGIAVKRMVNAGLEQRDISKRLGRPQSWVSYHYKAEVKLGTAAKKAYYAGDLTLEQALNIADVPEDAQNDVVEKVLNAGTRSEARKVAKKASKEAGTRRTYANKGRPTAKNLSQFVSDASFDADGAGTSKPEQAFYNGLAAGMRIALGDLEYEKVKHSEAYTDMDFHAKTTKSKEKVTAKKTAKASAPAKAKTGTTKKKSSPKKKKAAPEASSESAATA